MAEAVVTGDIADTIDPLFYPVAPDGTPLKAGDRIGLDGNPAEDDSEPYGIIEENNGVFSVKWTGQQIDWNGWDGRIYVKAKEDFPGGNTLNTNQGDATAVARSYTVTGMGSAGQIITGNVDLRDMPLSKRSYTLPTPYVNVRELALTENETEWKVYLGTEIDPKSQLEMLFRNILIRKVVSEDENEMITDKGQMLGETSEESKTMSLAGFLGLDTDEEIASFMEQLIRSDTKTITCPYGSEGCPSYGHGYVGDFVVSLEKAEGCFDRNLHAAEETGTDTEVILTVSYQPRTMEEREAALGIRKEDYHNGTGSPGTEVPKTENSMNSENAHVIRVFQKGLKLKKTDMLSGELIDTAEFTLSSPQKEDVVRTTSGGIVLFDPLEKPAKKEDGGYEVYTLTETKAPEGYTPIPQALTVNLNLQDQFTDPESGEALTDGSGNLLATPPEEGLYNWTETAKVTVGGTSTGFYELEGDPDTQNSEVTVVTYKIKNNPGVELPATGGPGRGPYTAAGLIWLLGTALLYGFRRGRKTVKEAGH